MHQLRYQQQQGSPPPLCSALLRRGWFFKRAIKEAENPPYAGITRQTIEKSMDVRKGTPALANNWLKTMRGFFDWSVKNEHMDTDPTIGVDRFKYRTDGFRVWDESDVRAFCERWPIGTKPRLALVLILVSGLRRSDVHRVGPQHVRGNVLTIRAQKPPHHQITVTLSQSALGVIEATPIGDMAFLTKENGKPFASKESFGNWFSARCREAGLETGICAWYPQAGRDVGR